MNIRDFLYAILGNIPTNVKVEFPMPDLSGLKDYIPTQVDMASMLKFLALFAAGSLVLGIVGRVVLGKRSSLNHAISSVMGILCIYVLTIVIYTFQPWELQRLLSPLPFTVFAGEYLSIFSLTSTSFSVVCYEIVSMLILAFLVNLIDTFLPQGEGIVGWYLLRLLTVVLAMLGHLAARWAFNAFLPDVLVSYAPMILLGVLIAMLLLSVLKVFLGVALAAVDPILGAIYTFFFSNIIGKQLSKAMVTTAVLCAIVYLLEHFGVYLICITQSALIAYVPMLAVLLVLWYLIGHVL